MKRKEILEIINMALDVIEKGRSSHKEGIPLVAVDISNYGTEFEVRIMDDGFRAGAPYDGIYSFDLDGPVSDRVLRTCKSHLAELSQKAERSSKEMNDHGENTKL